MKMITSFFSGALSGVVVGAVTALLLTPASGEDLKRQINERIQTAIDEGKSEMQKTEKSLTAQFETLKKGGK